MTEQEQIKQPTFGDRVKVTATLVRRQQYVKAGVTRKFWKSETLPAPRTGLLIGWRTISDGERMYEDEVGYVYEPQERQRAALVVFNERARPVLVPIDALEALP